MEKRIEELKKQGFSTAMAIILSCDKPKDLKQIVAPTVSNWLEIYSAAVCNSDIAIFANEQAMKTTETLQEKLQVYLTTAKAESEESPRAKSQLDHLLNLDTHYNTNNDHSFAKILAEIHAFACGEQLYVLRDASYAKALSKVTSDIRGCSEASFQLIVEFGVETVRIGNYFGLWTASRTILLFNEWLSIYQKTSSADVQSLIKSKLLSLAEKNHALLVSLHREARKSDDQNFIGEIESAIFKDVYDLYEFYGTLGDYDDALKTAVAKKLYEKAADNGDFRRFYQTFRNVHKRDDDETWKPIVKYLLDQTATIEELISLHQNLNDRDLARFTSDFLNKISDAIASFDDACAAAKHFPYNKRNSKEDNEYAQSFIVKIIANATDFEALAKFAANNDAYFKSEAGQVNLISLYGQLLILAANNFAYLKTLYAFVLQHETLKGLAADVNDKLTAHAKTFEERYHIYAIKHDNWSHHPWDTEEEIATRDILRDSMKTAEADVIAQMTTVENCCWLLGMRHDYIFIKVIDSMLQSLTANFSNALFAYKAVIHFKSKHNSSFLPNKHRPNDHVIYQSLLQNVRTQLLKFVTTPEEAVLACEAGRIDTEFYSEILAKTKTII